MGWRSSFLAISRHNRASVMRLSEAYQAAPGSLVAIQSLLGSLGVARVALLLRDQQTGDFEVSASIGIPVSTHRVTLAGDSLPALYFTSNLLPVSLAQLDKVPFFRLSSLEDRRALHSLGGEVVLPLSTPRGLMGLAVMAKQKRRWRRRDPQRLAATATRLAEVIESAEARRSIGEEGRAAEEPTSEPVEPQREAFATVVHELNNCLSIMLAQIQLLEGENVDRENLRQGIASVGRVTTRAVEVTQRLRSFFGQEQQTPFESLDINGLVEEVTRLIEPRFGTPRGSEQFAGNLEVSLGGCPRVMGDADQLREALTNLVSNAIDAIPSQGGWVRVTTGEEGGWTCIQVQDNGSGIPSDIRDRIFEPFFTTKGQKGMGLGLTIARRIASRHGGWLQVESLAEGGSLFRIGLPSIPSDLPEGSSIQKGGVE